MASGERFILDHDQIQAYFDRIELPEEKRQYNVADKEPETQLEYLTLLQRHHLVHIPFENLSYHYSHHRKTSIHPEALFQKIVSDKNGRGGVCYENNACFGILLRSIGFTLFSAGGRVFDGGHWTGWSHMVNIVTIGDQRYHLDVGFGSDGPIIPMKLDREGQPQPQPHVYPATARLRWDNISGNSDPNQRLWLYEYKMNQDTDFKTWYCFTELEFLPADYNMMNHYISSSPKTFFTRTIVGEKKVLGKDGQTVVGNLILGDKNLKWRINGNKEKEIIFQNEAERLQALVDHFGIHFGTVEREAIRGLPSELK